MTSVDISIPREKRPYEYRVALSPSGVNALTAAGHRVFVEHDAGARIGFPDEEYRAVGAHIVYSHEEAYARGQIVLRVSRPLLEDLPSAARGTDFGGISTPCGRAT